MNVREATYRLARALGDWRALARGRVAQRLFNRTIGRLAARILGRWWQ